ncbi:MAG: hypothetical protein AAGC90_02885 [Curtobacterium sp.]
MLIPEDSWESRYFRHLIQAGLAIRNRYGRNRDWLDPVTHRVPLGSKRWVYMDDSEVSSRLWDYTLTYAADHIDHTDEKRPRLYRKVKVAQMDRDIQRAAEMSGENWTEWGAEQSLKRRHAAVQRAYRATPRGKIITDDLVRPHLDSLQGLNFKQAAERLASWDWPTEKGRHSAATFNRVLHRLGFEPQGEQRRRSSDIKPEMYAGTDGMTNQQIADEWGVSLSTIKRTRPRAVAPLSDPEPMPSEGQEVTDRSANDADEEQHDSKGLIGPVAQQVLHRVESVVFNVGVSRGITEIVDMVVPMLSDTTSRQQLPDDEDQTRDLSNGRHDEQDSSGDVHASILDRELDPWREWTNADGSVDISRLLRTVP